MSPEETIETKLKPERIVEIKLWDWLKTKSDSIIEIYFNSKNEVGAPIFKVKGCQKKPDMIIKYNNGWGDKYCVVEVKDNSSSFNVLEANKIIHIYYKKYIEAETSYLINDEKIKIDQFVVATQSSMKGYLFDQEILLDNEQKGNGSKCEASKRGYIPRMEGNRTFDFIRILWSFYTVIRNDYEEKPGLGILIGNTNNNLSPHLMITDFNTRNKKWGQRWWKI